MAEIDQAAHEAGPPPKRSIGTHIADVLVANSEITLSSTDLELLLRKNNKDMHVRNAHIHHFFNKMATADKTSIIETLSLSGLYLHIGKRRGYHAHRKFIGARPSPILRSSANSLWSEENPFQCIYNDGSIVAVDYDWEHCQSINVYSPTAKLELTQDGISRRMNRRLEANRINSEEIERVAAIIAHEQGAD